MIFLFSDDEEDFLNAFINGEDVDQLLLKSSQETGKCFV